MGGRSFVITCGVIGTLYRTVRMACGSRDLVARRRRKQETPAGAGGEEERGGEREDLELQLLVYSL